MLIFSSFSLKSFRCQRTFERMPVLLVSVPLCPTPDRLALSLKTITFSHSRMVAEVQITILHREINKSETANLNVRISGESRQVMPVGGGGGGDLKGRMQADRAAVLMMTVHQVVQCYR